MPETFTQKTWFDFQAGSTPIVAAELNRIESGLKTIDVRATALEDARTIIAATIRTVSGTLVLAEAGVVVEMNSASATTLTVPPNASVAFPVGTVIEVLRLNTGTVTIVAGAGVTINPPTGSPLTLRVRYSAATLRKRGADEWILGGDLG